MLHPIITTSGEEIRDNGREEDKERGRDLGAGRSGEGSGPLLAMT